MRTQFYKKLFVAAAAVILAVGCGGNGGGGGGTATGPARSVAFVVTTDFQTGSFATLALDDPTDLTPASPERTVGSDAVARLFGELLYVVNRLFADNVQIIDPVADFDTVVQCSTGNGTNPHDIAVLDETKAYVTLYDTGEVLIVDPTPASDCSDFIRGSIDLTGFADADGNPEADLLVIANGELYVSVQRLDRNNFFTPAENASLLVIDLEADEVVREIVLSGSNPFATTKGLIVDDGAIVISQTGIFGVEDGGIERVDLSTGVPSGFFATEEALGGDLNDFVLADDIGFAVVSGADFSTSLVAFDPATGTLTDTLISGVSFLGDIEIDDRGRLWVADRSVETPGVRIFDVETREEVSDGSINLGLPPFEIVFVP